MNLRVLLHVQHLLGIGHAKRGAMLARAMGREGLAVTVLSGGEPVELDWGGAEIVQLPWARALDTGFQHIVDEADRPLDAAFHARRREQVLAALARTAPQALLVESYPFGRRAFRTELDALIATARERGIPVLVSIRDILVAKRDPRRIAEIVERVKRDIDGVLVHGDPSLVPLEASFPAAGEIASKVIYTGYVAEPPSDAGGDAGRGEVIVSAGGGAVGAPLLRAALAARPLGPAADRPWRLIAGPNLPEAEYSALRRAAGPGVTIERFRRDFPALLSRCHLSLSQAGYNTILDLLQARARAVVVPFAEGGETEQALRARILAERGLIQCVDARDLAEPGGALALAAAMERALAAPPPEIGALALDGGRRTAREIARLAINGSTH
ncbi:MAG TPA: glycosyltransferase [Stellaceae bacterium]|nr:glycosyltransferase [Stellaceae bacterium]